MNWATEQHGLVLQALSYSAYGHSVGGAGTSLGFNGERRSGFLQGYGLGNGHRFYRPALMRFLSPDALSPFGKGGVNAYIYCLDDPINCVDPTGRARIRFPGWARQVSTGCSVVSASKPVHPQTMPLHTSGNIEFRNGEGKFFFAKPGATAPNQYHRAAPVVGTKSSGPTIDQLAAERRMLRHWEHRPGSEPMSLDQMIPNHQRTRSPQITEIETMNAALREQRQHREIIHTLTASGGDL